MGTKAETAAGRLIHAGGRTIGQRSAPAPGCQVGRMDVLPLAAQAQKASTRTVGSVFLQLVYTMLKNSNTDRVLNAPTNLSSKYIISRSDARFSLQYEE